MSTRTRVRKKSEKLPKASSKVKEDVNPSVEMKVGLDNLRAQIDAIDSKLIIIGEKITPTDLKNIEEKMTRTLDNVNEVNNSLIRIEKLLHVFQTYAIVFNIVGIVGVLIVILYALKALRVI